MPGLGRQPNGLRAMLGTLEGSTGPPWKGTEAQAPPPCAEVSCEQVLPAPDRPCGYRTLPQG